MTPQEMFDKAYLGVIQQGRKSEKKTRYYGATCAYRGLHGAKCGIGHLIPDDLAKAWDQLTNSSIVCIKATKAHPIPDFITNNKMLATAIQEAHDHLGPHEFIKEFKTRMALVAKDFKLTIPQLPQLEKTE